jgi:hypothetical protein
MSYYEHFSQRTRAANHMKMWFVPEKDVDVWNIDANST